MEKLRFTATWECEFSNLKYGGMDVSGQPWRIAQYLQENYPGWNIQDRQIFRHWLREPYAVEYTLSEPRPMASSRVNQYIAPELDNVFDWG